MDFTSFYTNVYASFISPHTNFFHAYVFIPYSHMYACDNSPHSNVLT